MKFNSNFTHKSHNSLKNPNAIILIFILFTYLPLINSQFEGQMPDESAYFNENNEIDNFQQVSDPLDPDRTLERIRDYMWDIAQNIDRKPNLLKKKILIGALPDEYPENMKLKAKSIRKNKQTWDMVMLYPTAVWRSCVFPNFKLSYVSWCNQKLALSKTKTKLNGCLNNFCLVCCDHLQLNYREIANNSELGDRFLLSSNQGFSMSSNINYVVTDAEINSCRKACKKQYKIDMPYVLPTPPRDPNLGTTLDNPAVSCSDIKKWGSENAKSGEYWTESLSKGKQKVFCDMETDGGGWTLFYNYKHMPGQELYLDSSKLPKNLNDNSHMYLSNAGLSHQDVKELRFLCTESYKGNNVYWHFKTNNQQFISVALTGEQDAFRTNSLLQGYKELPPARGMNFSHKKRIFESLLDSVDHFGSSNDGGFHNTPFGSSKYGAYWTIRGPSPSNPRYECATSHSYTGGYTSPDSSPNMVKSHHSIWFRGEAPDEEKVQRRLLSRIRSDPS
jgi:hypothetical protein